MGTYKWWCPKCGSLNRYMGNFERVCSCCKIDTSEMNVEVIFNNDIFGSYLKKNAENIILNNDKEI